MRKSSAALLSDMLLDLFGETEALSRWLGRRPATLALLRELPQPKGEAPAQYAHRVANLLKGRGLDDAQFFADLVHLFPPRESTIRSVAGTYLAALKQEPLLLGVPPGLEDFVSAPSPPPASFEPKPTPTLVRPRRITTPVAKPQQVVIQLRITQARTVGRLEVQARRADGSTTPPATGALSQAAFEELRQAFLATLSPSAADGDSQQRVQRRLAQHVHDHFLSTPAGRAFDRELGHPGSDTPVRIELVLDAPYNELPWELMPSPDDGGAFLATNPNVEVVRLRSVRASAPAPRPHPRLLLVTASDSDGLQAARERSQVSRWWQGADVVDRPEFAQFKNLEQAFYDEFVAFPGEPAPFDVVHFAMHGGPGVLLFDDGEVDAEDVANLLAGQVSTAIFLSGCYTGASAMGVNTRLNPTDPLNEVRLPWGGTALTLLEKGIPDVVGISRTIQGKLASRAAGAWHRALRVGQLSPSSATAFARSLLRTGDRHDFGYLLHFTSQSLY